MSAFRWNRTELAATAVVCTVAVGFTVTMLMGMSEPTAMAADDEIVELSTPVAVAPAPTITELPVPVTTATPNWRDGYVPCDTPSGNTMVVGCYWDQGDQPYIVTDDGETFLIDDATGERTYVPENQAPWYATTPPPNVTLTPCATEDSDWCYWDAARMGNGEGTSFVRLDGVTYYPQGK